MRNFYGWRELRSSGCRWRGGVGAGARAANRLEARPGGSAYAARRSAADQVAAHARRNVQSKLAELAGRTRLSDPHGRVGVERLGGYDRSAWTAAALLPRSGCATIRIVADSDERTIRTAEAYAEALAPSCSVAIEHKPQDVADPIFSPIDERAVPSMPPRRERRCWPGRGRGGACGARPTARTRVGAAGYDPLPARLAAGCGRSRPASLRPSSTSGPS